MEIRIGKRTRGRHAVSSGKRVGGIRFRLHPESATKSNQAPPGRVSISALATKKDSGSSASQSPVLEASRRRALLQACRCAKAAEDFRGQETLVLDLTGVTPIVDYFVITTGTSNRQMRALADEVLRHMKKDEGQRPIGTEGTEGNSTWILYDFGDIVLHVFTVDARKLYDLEHLWADAPQVDWKAELNAEESKHAK